VNRKTVKLGDICEIQPGNSIPVKEKEVLYRNVNEGLPYVATKDVGFDGVIDYENGVRIPPNHSSKFKLSKKNSILVCGEGGSAGRKIAFSHKDCHFVNKLFSIRPGSKMASKYVYYYTLSNDFQNQFKKAMHGLIGGVSLLKINSFQITYPSLKEQKAIVAKLDAAFAEIDKAIESADAKEAETEKLKSSLLANELNIDGSEGVAVMWKTVKLGDVATVIAGQSPKGESYNKEANGTPFYQGKKDYGDKYLNPPTVWTTTVTKLAKKNDILMSVRAPIGALNFANQTACIGRGLAAIRASSQISNDYLFYALLQLSSKLVGSSGAIFNSINKKQIEDITFILPPLEEQKAIVAKLDAAFAEVETVKQSVGRTKTNYAALKSAILAQELRSEAA